MEDAPREQEYLIVTPLFEEGYGQPTTNFFRVVATSDVEAMCKATDIIGSEEWWEQVHGDDLDAREDTLVGDPMVRKVTMDEPKPPLFEPTSAPLSIDADSDDDAVSEVAVPTSAPLSIVGDTDDDVSEGGVAAVTQMYGRQ